jgi:hypothetical protein
MAGDKGNSSAEIDSCLIGRCGNVQIKVATLELFFRPLSQVANWLQLVAS